MSHSNVPMVLRMEPPKSFKGTPGQWRVLTESVWPSARTPEAIELALAYCGARRLDPFKRPVHIVPVWNSQLRKEVETVWPGINELLTTAKRTQAFAGIDEAEFGPLEKRLFSDKDGKVTVEFPIWCKVRVWSITQGVRSPTTIPVYWIESYGRRKFDSEVPNYMWSKRPRGQLAKCALAASLRAAFPEEISDYAAEEMEGRTIDAGGVIIDHETPAADAAEQLADDTRHTLRIDLLDTTNRGEWLKHLRGLLDAAADADEVAEVAGHRSVHAALAPESKVTPSLRGQIQDMLKRAFERFPAVEEEGQAWGDDPCLPFFADIEKMTTDDIAVLPRNGAWTSRVSKLLPPDQDRIAERLEQRKQELKG